jgi:hypothetical protein
MTSDESERDRLVALPPAKTGPTSTVKFVAGWPSVKMVYSRPGFPDEPARYFCGDLLVGTGRAERKLATSAIADVANLEFERENGPMPEDVFELTTSKGTKLSAWTSASGHVLIRFAISGRKRQMTLDTARHHGEIGGSGCHFQIDDNAAIERLIAMHEAGAAARSETWRKADERRRRTASAQADSFHDYRPPGGGLPWKYRNE